MIVVTGGAGFIGSNILATLEEAGAGSLCVVDWLGSGDKWRNLRARSLDEVVAPEALEDFLDRRGSEVSAVVHMGAVTSTAETDVDLLFETNVRLSQRLWRWCAAEGVRLVYASSAATYGDGAAGFDDDPAPEDLARLRPLNPYGWSKHVFDRWVAGEVAADRPCPPQWVGLKFFNVYGPNEYHKGEMRSLVARAFEGARAGDPVTLFRSHHPDYPDGGQLRDFVYVEDCADVVAWLLEHPSVSGLFNLGTGRAESWLDLTGALYHALGREPSVRWVDTPESLRDRYQYVTRAEMGRLRAAGYDRPFRSVADGVRRYVEEYLTRENAHR